MSDLFHELLPDEAIAAVFGVMASAPQHTFQILTKRPQRMRDLAGETGDECFGAVVNAEWYRRAGHLVPQAKWDWPLPNVWLGVSVQDQATADERIPLLLQTPAAVRFINLEPQLAHVNVERFLTPRCWRKDEGHSDRLECNPTRLDWVIQGGESGHGARGFSMAWTDTTREQCQDAGVAYFFKQAGLRPTCEETLDDPEWPAHVCYRMDHRDLRATNALLLRDRKGGDLEELHPRYRVRAFPKVGA
jgi:protein gp37